LHIPILITTLHTGTKRNVYARPGDQVRLVTAEHYPALIVEGKEKFSIHKDKTDYEQGKLPSFGGQKNTSDLEIIEENGILIIETNYTFQLQKEQAKSIINFLNNYYRFSYEEK
jgi:hypothetical protein